MKLPPKINKILGHKVSLNKYKKIEMIYCVLLNHNRIKLEINSTINYRNYTNSCRLNNTYLKLSVGHCRNQGKNKKFLELNEMIFIIIFRIQKR
jgi:hypothetical protein